MSQPESKAPDVRTSFEGQPFYLAMVAVALVVFSGPFLYRLANRRYYAQVTEGMSQDQIVSVAGQPELSAKQAGTEMWLYGIHHVREHPGSTNEARLYSLRADMVVLFLPEQKVAGSVGLEQDCIVSLELGSIPWWFSYALF